MQEILAVYICEDDGTIIFEYNPSEKEEEASDSTLFAGMILSIQSFARNMGEKSGCETIEIGKTKIFLKKDEETKLVFILKCTKEANEKKVLKVFSKIQQVFNTDFKPYFKKYSPKDLRLYISNLFKTSLEKILK